MPESKLAAQETAEALRLATSGAVLEQADTPGQTLRTALDLFAGERRGREVPPEAMLVELKAVFARAGIPAEPTERLQRLIEAAILHAIESYYREP